MFTSQRQRERNTKFLLKGLWFPKAYTYKPLEMNRGGLVGFDFWPCKDKFVEQDSCFKFFKELSCHLNDTID